MASATATATMSVAAGFDKRASTSSSGASSLQTPGSGTFPSEMLSPMATSPAILSRDELKTPITPPSAYLDFLRNMSPAMMSPAASTSTSARFSFHDKPSSSDSNKTSFDSTTSSTGRPSYSPPTSQPALSRNTSYDSTASSTTTTSSSATSTVTNSSSTNPAANAIYPAPSAPAGRTRPESPRVIIPPSPFAKPGAPRSARTPRRIVIPPSPLGSAASVTSPYSTTPLSAAPWSASFVSPREPASAQQLRFQHGSDGTVSAAATMDPSSAKTGRVSVRQVVTRTVTYCRTPTTALEPAPRGKRRKIEDEETSSVPSSAAAAEPVSMTKTTGNVSESMAEQKEEEMEFGHPVVKVEKGDEGIEG